MPGGTKQIPTWVRRRFIVSNHTPERRIGTSPSSDRRRNIAHRNSLERCHESVENVSRTSLGLRTQKRSPIEVVEKTHFRMRRRSKTPRPRSRLANDLRLFVEVPWCFVDPWHWDLVYGKDTCCMCVVSMHVFQCSHSVLFSFFLWYRSLPFYCLLFYHRFLPLTWRTVATNWVPWPVILLWWASNNVCAKSGTPCRN